MSRYEFCNRLTSLGTTGFVLKDGKEGTFQEVVYTVEDLGQGLTSFTTTLFKTNRRQGIVVEHQNGNLCSLSDLTQDEFQRLKFPRDELEELRELERKYKEIILKSKQDYLERVSQR